MTTSTSLYLMRHALLHRLLTPRAPGPTETTDCHVSLEPGRGGVLHIRSLAV